MNLTRGKKKENFFAETNMDIDMDVDMDMDLEEETETKNTTIQQWCLPKTIAKNGVFCYKGKRAAGNTILIVGSFWRELTCPMLFFLLSLCEIPERSGTYVVLKVCQVEQRKKNFTKNSLLRFFENHPWGDPLKMHLDKLGEPFSEAKLQSAIAKDERGFLAIFFRNFWQSNSFFELLEFLPSRVLTCMSAMEKDMLKTGTQPQRRFLAERIAFSLELTKTDFCLLLGTQPKALTEEMLLSPFIASLLAHQQGYDGILPSVEQEKGLPEVAVYLKKHGYERVNDGTRNIFTK